MNLAKFDNKCVRITTVDGNVFEGICCYSHEEYNEHEFGRPEPCLQMLSFLFFPSDIAQIASLEGRSGPYGRFSGPFGRLEELIVEDGIDSIRDALFSEEPEHALRILNCLETRLDSYAGWDTKTYSGVLGALRELADWTGGGAVKAAAERLLASRAQPPDAGGPTS